MLYSDNSPLPIKCMNNQRMHTYTGLTFVTFNMLHSNLRYMACKQANKHIRTYTHVRNAVSLVWDLLRLNPISKIPENAKIPSDPLAPWFMCITIGKNTLRLRDTLCSLIFMRKYYLPFLRAGSSCSTQ